MEFTDDQIKAHISMLERTLGFLRTTLVEGRKAAELASSVQWLEASIKDAKKDLSHAKK